MITQEHALWKGKPWVVPGVVGRTVLAIVAAIVISWFEFYFGWADRLFLNIQMFLWTNLVILLAWVASLVPLLLIRASSAYVLREDGLQIRDGILTSKSFVVAPAGFSDLEVTRSIADRILGMGNIIVRTQGDTDIVMKRVRNPLRVADQVRAVMSRPTVRIMGPDTNKGKPGQ